MKRFGAVLWAVVFLAGGLGAGCRSEKRATGRPASDAGAGPSTTAEMPRAAGDGGAPIADARVAAAPAPPLQLPEPWLVRNIGARASSSKAEYYMSSSASYLMLNTGSVQIGGREDSFQFVYQAIKGDAEIVGRVRNVDFTAAGAQAGLMIRASAEPGAPNVLVAVTGGLVGHVQARSAAGGDTMRNDADRANLKLNTWLRLVRTANTIKVYRGDRRTWTEVASYELVLPAEALFGLAATSGTPDLVGRYEFDGLRVSNLASDASLAGWFHEDIGIFGSVAQFEGGAGGSLSVRTFGAAWSGSNDFFSYLFREAMGDVSVVFRVASVEPAEAGARVAAIVRNGSVTSVSRGHAHAAASVILGKGAEFQHRAANSGSAMVSMDTADATVKPPVWLRVERSGNKFTGYHSPDGRPGTWKELGSAMVSGDPGMTVGVAVSSSNNRKSVTAVIDGISISTSAGMSGPADAGAPTPDAAPDAARDAASADRPPDARLDVAADRRR